MMIGVKLRVALGPKLVNILFGICLLSSFRQIHAHFEGERNSICVYHDTKYTCDCAFSNEPVELPALEGNVYHISIANCKNIFVFPHFLSGTFGLRSVSFVNVNNLVLQQNALAFPPLLSSTRLIIEFNNVTIKELQSHVFNGNIDEITFTSCRIDFIRPFAFTAFKDKAYFIKFIDTTFNMIEPQAFKKFSVVQLEIGNCVFLTPLPSRTFYDVDVKDFLRISNSTFRGAFSRAFSFSGVSMLTFVGNYFEKFDGECFELKVADKVLIRNNTFTDIHPALFREIQVTAESLQRSEKLEFCLFDNVVDQRSGPVPLYLSDNFQIALRKLYFASNANCDQINNLAKTVFFVRFEDFIYLRFSETDNYLTFNQMLHTNCKPNSPWLYIGVGLGCLLLLAILIAILAVYIVRKKRKTKLDFVMPESRTYRETQIVLQVENAGLLKTDL